MSDSIVKKKILIIEDEMAFQKLMGEKLTQEGYEVLKAENGKKGLEIAIEKHPNLILLDIRLPVMDGLEVLAKLRADVYGKTAKIIMLTNLEPDKEILKKVLEFNPALYLVKSNIKLADLAEKVKATL